MQSSCLQRGIAESLNRNSHSRVAQHRCANPQLPPLRASAATSLLDSAEAAGTASELTIAQLATWLCSSYYGRVAQQGCADPQLDPLQAQAPAGALEVAQHGCADPTPESRQTQTAAVLLAHLTQAQTAAKLSALLRASYYDRGSQQGCGDPQPEPRQAQAATELQAHPARVEHRSFSLQSRVAQQDCVDPYPDSGPARAVAEPLAHAVQQVCDSDTVRGHFFPVTTGDVEAVEVSVDLGRSVFGCGMNGMRTCFSSSLSLFLSSPLLPTYILL